MTITTTWVEAEDPEEQNVLCFFFLYLSFKQRFSLFLFYTFSPIRIKEFLVNLKNVTFDQNSLGKMYFGSNLDY